MSDKNMKNRFETLTSLLTHYSNDYHLRITKAQRKFLKIAFEINNEYEELFSVLDFEKRGYSKVNFRYLKYKLKDVVKEELRTSCCFYRLKDVHIPGIVKNLTHEDTGEGVNELVKNIASIKELTPKIHDIGMRFSSPETLHQSLVEKEYSVDRNNKGIRLNVELSEYRTTAKVIIYPKIGFC